MESAEDAYDNLLDGSESRYQRLDDRDVHDGRREVPDIAIYRLRCSKERHRQAVELAAE